MRHAKTYVVDNSVMIKPLLKEEDAGKVRRLLYLKDEYKLSLLVPDIFRYEFFNKVTKEFDAEVAHDSWNVLTERQISIIPLENDLIEATNRLLIKYPKASFYDAAYHALAKAYRVVFITADVKYYHLTKAEGDVKLLKNLKL